MCNFVILAAAGGGLGELVQEKAMIFGFDWWMFLSQCISFIIVCVLLAKFAYKPVLNVLEERRERIAEGLANADKIKQQLAEAEVRYNEILAKANVEAQKMLDGHVQKLLETLRHTGVSIDAVGRLQDELARRVGELRSWETEYRQFLSTKRIAAGPSAPEPGA